MKHTALLFILLFSIENMRGQEAAPACSSEALDHYLDSLLPAIQKKYLRSDLFQKLRNQKLSEGRSVTNPIFEWPLRPSPGYSDIPNYYTISNYVDLDTTVFRLDYQCGSRTYDNHRGTDITLFPFMWHMMEEEYVEVLAAADGIVTTVREDEENDDNCDGCDSPNSTNNAVIIMHADSSIAIYYHIKSHSVPVEEDDIVKAGDVIALVASSGCSTGPHLHFEVRAADLSVVDPFFGPCNTTTTQSWWADEKPYWAPEVNRVMCHSEPPQLVGLPDFIEWCPSFEEVHAKNLFSPGDDIVFGVAMKDIQNDMSVTIDVYNSNGLLIFEDDYLHTAFHDNALYLLFEHQLAQNSPAGTYFAWVKLGALDYYHYFSVECLASYTLTGNQSAPEGYIADNNITSSRVMTNPVPLLLQAGTEIRLTPGFHAIPNSSAHLVLRDCDFSH